MNEDDGSLTDEPLYRAGLLMGRKQAVTDVMGLILHGDGDAPGKLKAIVEWCVQATDESKTELALVVQELQDGDWPDLD